MAMLSEAPTLPVLCALEGSTSAWPVDPDHLEWVDGAPKEKNTGFLSSMVASNLSYFLKGFVRDHPLGRVAGPDAGYRCFATDATRLRRPDVSFISYSRLPAGPPPLGEIEVAPDLAVEVVSPNDLSTELQEKVLEYLAAGVRLVWLIDPQNRCALAYGPGVAVSFVTEDGILDGGEVLPGFMCRLGDVLEPE